MKDLQIQYKPETYSTNFNNHFRDRKDLKPIEKYVMLDITNRAGEKGIIWWGTEKLAKELQMSKPTLIKILKNLEKKGGLLICDRFDKTTKSQKSNRIYVAEIDYYTGNFKTEQLEAVKLLYPDKKIYE